MTRAAKGSRSRAARGGSGSITIGKGPRCLDGPLRMLVDGGETPWSAGTRIPVNPANVGWLLLTKSAERRGESCSAQFNQCGDRTLLLLAAMPSARGWRRSNAKEAPQRTSASEITVKTWGLAARCSLAESWSCYQGFVAVVVAPCRQMQLRVSRRCRNPGRMCGRMSVACTSCWGWWPSCG